MFIYIHAYDNNSEKGSHDFFSLFFMIFFFMLYLFILLTYVTYQPKIPLSPLLPGPPASPLLLRCHEFEEKWGEFMVGFGGRKVNENICNKKYVKKVAM